MSDAQSADAWAAAERQRVDELLSVGLLDTRREERFDRYTRLAAELFAIPVAAISLVDSERQWFKSCVGKDVDAIEHSFCSHAIDGEFMEVPDLTTDPRFRDNRDVSGPPYFRYYAGAVLFGPAGRALGTLCLLDYRPRRPLTWMQRGWLMSLARFIEEEIAHNQALQRTGEQVRQAVLHDGVTGLPNEALLREQLDAVSDSRTGDDDAFAVAHVIVANLDELIGLHGDAAVSGLMATLAKKLDPMSDGILAAGRLSRKRFALAEHLGAHGAVLERLVSRQESLNEPVPASDGRLMRPQITMGISVFPLDGTAAGMLLDRARIALAGPPRGDGVHLYRAGTHAAATRRFELREALQRALEADALNLHFQPVFLADGHTLVGFEALLRWFDGPGGTVSPAEFVPVAEDSETLTRGLTRFVLRQACHEAAGWCHHASLAPRIAVNIAANEFRQSDFAALVRSVLADTGLDPRRLTLELTEETLLADLQAATATMEELRAMGVRLALDDFGTGYSSLSYLRRLPVNTLKIDKAFLRELMADRSARETVRGIVHIARGMGLRVIAEGVESEPERQLLERLRCDMVQGFHTGRPGDAAAARAWLQRPVATVSDPPAASSGPLDDGD